MTDRIDEIKAALAEPPSQYERWTAGDDVVLWETADMVAHGRDRLAWCVGEIERLRGEVHRVAYGRQSYRDTINALRGLLANGKVYEELT